MCLNRMIISIVSVDVEKFPNENCQKRKGMINIVLVVWGCLSTTSLVYVSLNFERKYYKCVVMFCSEKCENLLHSHFFYQK